MMMMSAPVRASMAAVIRAWRSLRLIVSSRTSTPASLRYSASWRRSSTSPSGMKEIEWSRWSRVSWAWAGARRAARIPASPAAVPTLSRVRRSMDGAETMASLPPRGAAPALPPQPDRDVLALARADIELARPGDLLLGVVDHLLPLRQPARGPGDRKEHGEHLDREAHRLVDQAGVEVDVGIELAGDEVLVLERDPLELPRDGQERIRPGHLEGLVGHPLDDLGARIVVLVHPVAEPHQPRPALLHLPDEVRNPVLGADGLQHPGHG